MSADQIAIYSAFLASYNNGSKSVLNVGNRTVPLELSPEERKGCLKGILLENLAAAQRQVHLFQLEDVKGRNVRLVDSEKQAAEVEKNDPQHAIQQGKDEKQVDKAVDAAFASGLLEVSEVAFDKHHRYAVMSFSFVCGGLCGHGGTVVFRKVGGHWKETSRSCGSWIS